MNKEYEQAEACYRKARDLKEDMYDPIISLANLDFERGKLAMDLAIASPTYGPRLLSVCVYTYMCFRLGWARVCMFLLALGLVTAFPAYSSQLQPSAAVGSRCWCTRVLETDKDRGRGSNMLHCRQPQDLSQQLPAALCLWRPPAWHARPARDQAIAFPVAPCTFGCERLWGAVRSWPEPAGVMACPMGPL